ncbi:hypothetical protein [Acinetobacter stercoris]|uniref:Uncharacterized protein n=1 Tax=Acinetobacter stercoris TaxID=2126983 RepID=A0A2U3MZQ4_9GAMM|nr:hypothetical protein [Acinetobacter stercoris]SPL70865.1 hypothetical protein KPC_2043 [Acinetobacter stercoris]
MQVVEAIGIYLGLDLKDFNAGADQAILKNQKLESSLESVEQSAEKTSKSTQKLSEEQKKATQALSEMGQVVTGVHKLLTGLFTTIAVSTGFSKLISDAQKTNNELYRLEKQLGISAGSIAAWQGAAAMAGGSAESMTSTLQGLSRGINDLVTMGDASLLPFLNALGVGVMDSAGNIRNMDDILLDMSDSFSKMDSQRAYSIGSKMGLDNGTIATLLEGRDALQEMLDLQKSLYTSSAEELKASRELSKQQALLNTQYESLKVMLGNALVPVLIEITKAVNGFFQFLHRNEKTVKNVFGALSFILGTVLIPIIYKAAIAMAALIAPFAPFILTVAALGAAFIALYDDYKTWAEGGQSLFNWGAFTKYIDDAEFSVDNLKNGFAYLLTGYTDWAKAAEGGREWMKLKGFIDENGVSVNSLIRGFNNLSKELINDAIPTLKGYASILQKLLSGDFKGAFLEAGQMMRNLVSNEVDRAKSWGDRIAGALDIGTGQQVGTFTQSSGNIMNSDVKSNQKYSGRAGSNSLSSFIGKGEGSYNSVNLGKRYGYKSGTKNLTSMTVDQVRAMQARREVNAVGKFQIIRDTMPSVIKGMGLSGKELFNEDLQEKMGAWLLFNKRTALGDYLKGKHNNLKLAGDEGAREWASLPVLSDHLVTKSGNKTFHSKRGATAYSDGVNKAQHSAESWEKALIKARKNYLNSVGNGVSEQEAQLVAFKDIGLSQQRSIGAQNAQSMINQGQQAKYGNTTTSSDHRKYIDVKIGDVNVHTSSSTISGTVNDGMNAALSNANQLITGMS